MLATHRQAFSAFAILPGAYDILRLAGTAYLLWFSYRAFTNASSACASGKREHKPGR